MTALDPTPIVRELENQWELRGTYDPDTVRKLLAVISGTQEIEVYARADRSARPSWAGPSPVPRGGRQTWPAGESARPRQVIPFPGLCGEAFHVRDHLAYFCGERPGHGPSPHVAYGYGNKIVQEWPSSTDRPPA